MLLCCLQIGNILLLIRGEVEGARCSIVDDRARQWFVESTPGSVIIDRGGTSLTIACAHPNYQTSVRQVDGSYSALLALNAWPFLSEFVIQGSDVYTYLVQGGLVLLGVGADVAQGSHITLPQKVSIPLSRPLNTIDSGSPGPLSPRTVLPSERGQRILEGEQEAPLSPFDEVILESSGN